jgi:PAS domain S-box-containing protein
LPKPEDKSFALKYSPDILDYQICRMKTKNRNPRHALHDFPQPVRLKTKIKSRTHRLSTRETAIDYYNLLENLPVLVYAAEPRPPFAPIYISPAFASLGYPLEDWYANADLWMRAIHAEDRERILAATREAMLADAETDYEYRLTTRDGDIRWVRDRGCFIRDANGEAIAWQGVVIDITTHKQAEALLTESEIGIGRCLKKIKR